MRNNLIVVLFGLIVAGVAGAYQVTGTVLESSRSKLIVKKGSEKFEMALDDSTKGGLDIKPGEKVTVEYRMTASRVDVKDKKGKAAKK